MQIGRRTIMVAGTFFLAAATGHMMQSGLLAGSRLVYGGQDGVVGELTQASLTSADGSGDVTPDVAAGDLAGERLSVPVFPELPKLEPIPLVSGDRFASRTDGIQSDADWPRTAATPEYDNFGQPCTEPGMVLALSAPAMIDVSVTSSCHANERIVISHAGLGFAGMTDEKGRYHTVVPAMSAKGAVSAQIGPDLMLADERMVPDIASVRRFALVQRGQGGLHLNAFIGDSAIGNTTDLQPENSGAGQSDGGGFMIILGDGAMDRPMTTEVISVPSNQLVPRLQVVVDVTDKTCGRDLLGSILRMSPTTTPITDGLSLAVPGCDAVGERVVLDMERADAAVALASSVAPAPLVTEAASR